MIDAQVKQGMLCPLCKTDLMMTDRQGVEVDYCPRCRGVWLDRGELDKIIDRSATMEASPGGALRGVPERASAEAYGHADPRYGEARRYRDDDDDDRYRDDRYRHDPRYRRKKSWLGDILDFD